MALPRFVLASLVAAALVAPFVLVARAGDALLAPLTERSVAALLRLTQGLPPRAPTPPAPLVEVLSEAPIELVVQHAAGANSRAKKPAVKALGALFVSRATVLQLARSTARPRGSFVPASSSHPAGLQLSGVAGLGIGLQDGDILIEALGIAPRAPAEIIGAVIEARAKRVEALSGTLWRRGQTFRITVQQPY